MKHCCEDKGQQLMALRESQAAVLKIALAINAAMFFIEFSYGVVAQSAALLADSLDMLGDSIVYGFSLYVLHRSIKWKARAALFKGIIIVVFGVGVLAETIHKALSEDLPRAEVMGWVGGMALVANVTCLVLLYRHRADDINMRSTWECSRNDVISNVGVILAALAVYFTHSKWPDIAIGLIIAALFLRSAYGVLIESLRVTNAPESK